VLCIDDLMIVSGDGIIPLTVPTQTPDTCYLQTLTDCVNGTTNCTLQTTSRLRLVGSVRDVVIQTSSKFYKPGETSELFAVRVGVNWGGSEGGVGQLPPPAVRVNLIFF